MPFGIGRIADNGRVGIGMNSSAEMTGNYGLFVKDGILTERCKVAVRGTSDWADFVFNKSFKLLPIYEVENYIITNNHLPNVPSASEVVKTGIDVAQMDALLLQKIEELTLYIIDLKKENDNLKNDINVLNNKIK